MKTNELLYIAKNKLLSTTSRPEIVMEKGKGLYLYDTEGNRYLDFIGGWAVNCLGHSPQVISEAITKQAKQLVNGSPSFYNTRMLEYAELLTNNCCFDKVFFSSTGAEANEGAIKLARKYGYKFKKGAAEIITMENSFHGRTLATMSATGKKKWQNLFEPKAKGFLKAKFNDFASVQKLVSDKTCAIMIEPIQGEGGVNVATNDFVKKIRSLCDQEKILFIFDEVQTGFGRTGKLFAYEHFKIEPDIMTLGKGIGGGFPLSALATKKSLDIFETGDQGGTYTGQPLGMAVGLAVLQELLQKKLVENCRQMGSLIKSKLSNLASCSEIKNIRGEGLLLAFDLTKTSASLLAKKCLDDFLIINALREDSIRLMPPLVISEKEIEKMITILEKNLLT